MAEKDNKLTYEQLENAARTFQSRMLQAEAKLQHINLTQLSLDYLFKVLDRADKFSPEFIHRCATEIEHIIFAYPEEGVTEDNTEDTKEEA